MVVSASSNKIHIFSYLDTGRIEALQTSSISKDSFHGVVTSNDDSTVIDLLQKLDKRIDGLEKDIQLKRSCTAEFEALPI